MTPTKTLLNTIEENAVMARDSLSRLLNASDDVDFTEVLDEQIEEYASIAKEADERLRGDGDRSKKIQKARCSAFSSMNITLMIDKSIPRMAEMVILGSTMGMIDIVKAIKEYDGYDSKALSLAVRLKDTEENNIRSMFEYV